uniref:Ribonuclease VapC n=1 Tax=Candidatus Kentrum sp. UNK TaxID=2126344 RepID=A0A451AQJ1_9GAMM|nr:MAG: Predicted nucleic acid-binding protein, contains PIN domain [Candidatus Kentron sp. UNK]VFK73525.1 MAG: Predicted nucleic acid-binding protein, contains PIN domain [Candidatus Kentron sp. UNK]
MMPNLLVDTDIFIDFFRGDDSAMDLRIGEIKILKNRASKSRPSPLQSWREALTCSVEANAGRIVLSSIVVAELYAGAKDEELSVLDELPRLFPVEPVTPEIARLAGLLKGRYARSHGVGLADALIAATAKQHGLDIGTLNIKYFPMFSGLEPPYRK